MISYTSENDTYPKSGDNQCWHGSGEKGSITTHGNAV